MPLIKSQLEGRIYSRLESAMIPRMQKANATTTNINAAKKDLRSIAKSVSEGVIDEIQENGFVELSIQVNILRNVVLDLLSAILSAPVAPMDGGATFKIFLSTRASSGISTLASLIPSEKIK